MNYMSIVIAGAILGGLGLGFGLLLGLASKFFSVEKDPRIDQIRENLPGANCGGCGYPGCDAFAAAVAEGKAPANGCTVSNAEARARIAAIMGVEAVETEPLELFVQCRGSLANTQIRYAYEGLQDCAAAASLVGGYKACSYACLGLGSCAKVCPTGALSIEDGLATVDNEKCILCGKCVSACPRGVLTMVPASSKVRIKCHTAARGREVLAACSVGCIACGMCVRACKFGAIKLVNNLPVFDYSKCVGCMACAEACPRKCIQADLSQRKVAYIHEDQCIGCEKCKSDCPFSAITGEFSMNHHVDPEKCKGCGQCQDSCDQKAITMIKR